MRITIKNPLVRDRVQERSGFTVNPYFWDDTTLPWTANTPTTVDYRLDCLATGANLIGWTTVTPGTTVAIAIPSANNAIQSDLNPYEMKQLTVRINANLTTQYQTAMQYQVDNLFGQT